MPLNKCLLALACLAALLSAPSLQAASRQEFDKAVRQLQDNPGDTALRRKIFKMAQGLKSLPEIPDEVSILKGKATYIVKSASSPADYAPAVEAYKKAALLAPWVPELYYNLGLVQEKAGQPKDAADSFKLYLAADPEAEDRDKVLSKLGALEVQQERQAQQSQPASRGSAAAADPAALRAWEGQKGGQIAIGVVGGLSLGMGALFVGIGLGDMSSATYYTRSTTVSGTSYNKLYDGKYFSTSSLKKYTDGETMMGVGWAFMGVGLLGVIIAVAMDPGPKPTALLDVEGGDLALSFPQLQPARNFDGLQVELLQARF